MENQKRSGMEHSDFDVMARVIQLMEERNWTQNELVKKSGIKQSTVSSWWHSDYAPNISSIEKLCKAFGITLTQFFSEDAELQYTLTSNQRNLISASAKLSDKQYEKLISFIETL